jgi:hypothetical protein
MSKARREYAAEVRADSAYDRGNIAAGVGAVWRTPIKFLTEPQEITLLGVTLQASRPAVLMPGSELRMLNRRGEVVYAQKAPDWEISLRSYALFNQDNPRPLTARQRAKLVRRGG